MEDYDEDAEENQDVDSTKDSDDEEVPKPAPTSQDASVAATKISDPADDLADLFSKTSLGPPSARD